MSLPKTRQSIIANFEEYLAQNRKVSRKTLRNYRADLSHFTAWTVSNLQAQGINVSNLEQILPYFSGQLVANYKGYHLDNQTPESTTNRRLSTLRNFSRFLQTSGIVKENSIELVSNVKQISSWDEQVGLITQEFGMFLSRQNVSKVTLKNYLSDVRQFLCWIPQETRNN